jgi:deazaflavin-dependent oxidoreductase (nitroreductase family)
MVASTRSSTGVPMRLLSVMVATAPRPLMEFVRRHTPTAIEEITVVGRRSGQDRSLLLTVADDGPAWYVVHPVPDRAGWVANLKAAGRATVVRKDGTRIPVRAALLDDGAERRAAIEAVIRAQRFPASVGYRLARRGIHEVGRCFRLDPEV